jgi:hypothetical protein
MSAMTGRSARIITGDKIGSTSRGCPPGDERGRNYNATNSRARESWSALDFEHSCGGA